MEATKEIKGDLADVDWRKAPYRVIMSEMAREEGVSRNAIRQGIFKIGNSRLREIFMERVDKVKQTTDKYNSRFATK